MVLQEVFQNPLCGLVLNPDFQQRESYVKVVADNVELANCIGNCIKNKDWQPLFDDCRWFYILLMGYHLYLLTGFRTPTSIFLTLK